MSKKKSLLAILLTVSIMLYLIHFPLVNAIDTSGSKTWGTPMTIIQHIVIGGSDEIPKGDYAYVFNKQNSPNIQVMAADWEKMMSGDLSDLKTQIESHVSGAQVVWIGITWDSATKHYFTAYDSNGNPITLYNYIVNGFYVEALVKNVVAGLTGLEIVAIIAIVTFMIVVLVLLGNFSWVTWQVMNAAVKLGPAVTIGVGILIIMAVLVTLLLLFGVGFNYTGKKRSVSIGRPKN